MSLAGCRSSSFSLSRFWRVSPRAISGGTGCHGTLDRSFWYQKFNRINLPGSIYKRRGSIYMRSVVIIIVTARACKSRRLINAKRNGQSRNYRRNKLYQCLLEIKSDDIYSSVNDIVNFAISTSDSCYILGRVDNSRNCACT